MQGDSTNSMGMALQSSRIYNVNELKLITQL